MMQKALLISVCAAVFLCGSFAQAVDNVFYAFNEQAPGYVLAAGESVLDSASGLNAAAGIGSQFVAGPEGGGNGALTFPESESRLHAPAFDMSGSFTIETRFRSPDKDDRLYIAGIDTSGETHFEWRFNADGKLGFKWNPSCNGDCANDPPNTDSQKLEIWSEGPVLDDDQWHHVAYTVDQAAQTAKYYVDYVLEASSFSPHYSGIQQVAEPMTIGGRSSAGRTFPGAIDFIKISDGILSPDQFVPEPSTSVLAICGIIGLLGVGYRRRNRSA